MTPINERLAVALATNEGGVFFKAVKAEQGSGTIIATARQGGNVAASLGIAAIAGVAVAAVSAGISILAGSMDYLAVSLLCFGPVTAFWVFWIALYYMNTQVDSPNVRAAKAILKTGEFDITPVVKLTKSRPLMVDEAQKVMDAKALWFDVSDPLFFDSIQIHTGPTFTIAGHLFLNQDDVDNDYLDAILASEVGHLSMGDPYVVAALWRLGKGIFQEHISIGGAITDKPQYTEDTIKKIASAAGNTLMGRQGHAAADIGTLITQSVGSGVRKVEGDIESFWRILDPFADAYAQIRVEKDRLIDYLQQLALDERNGKPRYILAQPAVVRLDAAMRDWDANSVSGGAHLFTAPQVSTP